VERKILADTGIIRNDTSFFEKRLDPGIK